MTSDLVNGSADDGMVSSDESDGARKVIHSAKQIKLRNAAKTSEPTEDNITVDMGRPSNVPFTPQLGKTDEDQTETAKDKTNGKEDEKEEEDEEKSKDGSASSLDS